MSECNERLHSIADSDSVSPKPVSLFATLHPVIQYISIGLGLSISKAINTAFHSHES